MVLKIDIVDPMVDVSHFVEGDNQKTEVVLSKVTVTETKQLHFTRRTQ